MEPSRRGAAHACRVVRSPPPTPARPAAPAALGLGPRKDELLHRSLARPHGDRFLREDLDHRRNGVGIIADHVEDDRTYEFHEAAGIVDHLHIYDYRLRIF